MTIKQFSQMDPQWKANLLGFDKTSTIGGYGCLLTSLTMCATHYGASDLTPATLNDKMRAVEERLALRSKPFIAASTLICRIPKGAELIALGKPNIAAKKVGKMGKWIHVRDVNGKKGYVAAWLVKERPESPAPRISPKDC